MKFNCLLFTKNWPKRLALEFALFLNWLECLWSNSALDWPQKRHLKSITHTHQRRNQYLIPIWRGYNFSGTMEKTYYFALLSEKWFQLISFCFLYCCSKNWSLMGWLSFGLFVITYQDTLLDIIFQEKNCYSTLNAHLYLHLPLNFGTNLAKKLWLFG